MQNIPRKLSSLILALLLLCGIVPVGSVSVTAAEDDYYASVTAAYGEALLGQVHDLITTTHTYYSTYSDCQNETYAKNTDPGKTSGYIMEFYSQEDLTQNWESGTSVGEWNREHLWCKSLSNGLWKNVSSSSRGGGADLHHIRPTEYTLNSSRGNNRYGEVNGGNPAWFKGKNGQGVAIAGYNSGGTFEPLDQVKGDVARIVMYVYTHYNTYSNLGGSTNGKGSGNYFGTLKFSNVMSAQNEDAAIELLLAWNESDPVDDIERTRNDAVCEIQGNRNPFVDHPEYAEAIWGDAALADKIPTALTISPSSLSMTVGESSRLTVMPTPADASDAVRWSVSDSAVVSVADGVVTAKGAGTATVIATSTLNDAVTARAEITVTDPAAEREERLKAFRAAVAAILPEGTVEERFASLQQALSAYLVLSEEEKSAAQEDADAFRAAVDAYNEWINSLNKKAGDADRAAFGSAGSLLNG